MQSDAAFERNPEVLEILERLSQHKRIVIWGAGKAAFTFSKKAISILKDANPDITLSGAILGFGEPSHSEGEIKFQKVREKGSNWPTEKSVEETQKLLHLLENTPSSTPVLGILTGGSSAMLCAPIDEVKLEQKIRISKRMSSRGCGIKELNLVRSVLSKVKRGGLMRFVKSHCTTLLLSDVVGDQIESIGSGPTHPLPIDPIKLKNIVAKYDLNEFLSDEMWLTLAEKKNKHTEAFTSKPENIIFASNNTAIDAFKREATSRGYTCEVVNQEVESDATSLADTIKKKIEQEHGARKKCFIWGGEITVKLDKNATGKGGRNQELCLHLLKHFHKSGWPKCAFISLATDGEDGETNVAGCILTPEIANQLIEDKVKLVSSLNNHDSFHFFENTGAHIKTGLTQTNVMDVYAVLFP